jgi:hypothetical protein
MADPFTWTDLGRWLLGFRRVLPDKVLRWVWKEEALLDRLRVFTVAEPPPHFFVAVNRENPELSHLRFNIFNPTPFKLEIVAVTGTLSLEDRQLFVHEQRLVTPTALPPFENAIVEVRHQITEPQAERLRAYQLTSARIRMDGGIYLRTPFGERRKPMSCDLDARIIK